MKYIFSLFAFILLGLSQTSAQIYDDTYYLYVNDEDRGTRYSDEDQYRNAQSDYDYSTYDDEDYYYSSRIMRFNRPYYNFNFYSSLYWDPFYSPGWYYPTNYFWSPAMSYYSRPGFYITFGWSPWRTYGWNSWYGRGYGWNSWYGGGYGWGCGGWYNPGPGWYGGGYYSGYGGGCGGYYGDGYGGGRRYGNRTYGPRRTATNYSQASGRNVNRQSGLNRDGLRASSSDISMGRRNDISTAYDKRAENISKRNNSSVRDVELAPSNNRIDSKRGIKREDNVPVSRGDGRNERPNRNSSNTINRDNTRYERTPNRSSSSTRGDRSSRNSTEMESRNVNKPSRSTTRERRSSRSSRTRSYTPSQKSRSSSTPSRSYQRSSQPSRSTYSRPSSPSRSSGSMRGGRR